MGTGLVFAFAFATPRPPFPFPFLSLINSPVCCQPVYLSCMLLLDQTLSPFVIRDPSSLDPGPSSSTSYRSRLFARLRPQLLLLSNSSWSTCWKLSFSTEVLPSRCHLSPLLQAYRRHYSTASFGFYLTCGKPSLAHRPEEFFRLG